jgi:hypothetical protein
MFLNISYVKNFKKVIIFKESHKNTLGILKDLV